MDSFTISTYSTVPENTMDSEQQQYNLHSASSTLNANTVISNVNSAVEIAYPTPTNTFSINYNNNLYMTWQQQQYMQQVTSISRQVPTHTLSNEALLVAPQNDTMYHDMNGVQMKTSIIPRQFDHQLGSLVNNYIPFTCLNSQQTTIPLNSISNQVLQSPIPQIHISSQEQAFYDNSCSTKSINSLSTKINYSKPTITNHFTSIPLQPLNQKSNSSNNSSATEYKKIIPSPIIPLYQSISTISNKDSTSKLDTLLTSDQPTTVSVTVTYIPKTRHVETYGGIDLEYFKNFEIKHYGPYFKELGIVDINALIMSLKSNMKMEVANALNTLTTITLLSYPLQLYHCEDLLDILLDHFEHCISEYFKYSNNNKKIKFNSRTEMLTWNGKSIYSELFETSLLEMKSLIPSLEQTSSDRLLSLREKTYCTLNILHNLSFIEENIDYLAKHHRFITVLVSTLKSVQSLQDSTYINRSNENNFISSDDIIRDRDILDIRKSILVILANISIAVTTLEEQKDSLVSILNFICDFLINESDTYYSLLAMEFWNKLLVHDANRQTITNLLHANTNYHHHSLSTSIQQTLLHIWKSLISLLRRYYHFMETIFFSGINNNQLATLEMIMMGLYNIVVISDIIFCQHLIKEEDGIVMTILRICTTLAELNNKNFRVMAQRGLETIYLLILGGGVKTALLIKNQQRKCERVKESIKQNSLFPISYLDLEDEDIRYKQNIKRNTQKLFNVSILNEKLMVAMLNPASDRFIIAGLNDISSFIEEVVYTK
ncbi:unnamed protein product [Cunninghamella echinulata]